MQSKGFFIFGFVFFFMFPDHADADQSMEGHTPVSQLERSCNRSHYEVKGGCQNFMYSPHHCWSAWFVFQVAENPHAEYGLTDSIQVSTLRLWDFVCVLSLKLIIFLQQATMKCLIPFTPRQSTKQPQCFYFWKEISSYVVWTSAKSLYSLDVMLSFYMCVCTENSGERESQRWQSAQTEGGSPDAADPPHASVPRSDRGAHPAPGPLRPRQGTVRCSAGSRLKTPSTVGLFFQMKIEVTNRPSLQVSAIEGEVLWCQKSRVLLKEKITFKGL